jgi:3-hydroxybutyryl-CoA dehydrogenase
MRRTEQAAKTTIAIVGAGTMGSGIALAALAAGLTVTLYDIAPEMLERGRGYIQKHLARKRKEAALEHLALTTRLEDLAGAAVVIEAAPEDLALKQELFSQLDPICPPPAILATNTSTLSITAIAAATNSPERVGGMHFFNPAPLLPLVEVGHGAQTSEETVQALVALAGQMGKTPVVTRDTPGFIVNRVARPFYSEALRLLGEGVATHQQIDWVIQLGGGFPMGPFQLLDLIGLDINLAATQSIYEQTFHEPRYRPHWIQQQKVQQNALGRKTGRGFYDYSPDAPAIQPPAPPPITANSGMALISAGSWAPGVADLCQRAGYALSRGDVTSPLPDLAPVVGLVVAGRSEGLREQVRRLDQVLPTHVPLLCQAADVTVGEIATGLEHPERLAGFDGLFSANGPIATLVPSPFLAKDTRAAAEAFFHSLGRYVVWIADSPALILPRVVCMLANEAAFAVGESIADGDTIDQAMTLGVNYPQGPLAWAQEIGHGRVVAVLDHLQAEYGEERYRVAPLLRRWARLDQIPAAPPTS